MQGIPRSRATATLRRDASATNDGSDVTAGRRASPAAWPAPGRAAPARGLLHGRGPSLHLCGLQVLGWRQRLRGLPFQLPHRQLKCGCS